MAGDIMGIGMDIEETSRFKPRLKDSRFLSKIFTKSELEYCFSKAAPEQALAARFCAKEAVIKASPVELFYNEIEIEKKGKNPALKVKNPKFKYRSYLSISHTKTHAIALVILTR